MKKVDNKSFLGFLEKDIIRNFYLCDNIVNSGKDGYAIKAVEIYTTDGTPSNIALKSDLPTAPQTWAESLPGYDATKTQTLKNIEGTLTWVDDE